MLHGSIVGIMASFTAFLVVTYFSYSLKRYYDLYELYQGLNGRLSNFLMMSITYMKGRKDLRDSFMKHLYAALVVGMTNLQNELSYANCLIPMNTEFSLISQKELKKLSLIDDFSGSMPSVQCIHWALEDYEEFSEWEENEKISGGGGLGKNKNQGYTQSNSIKIFFHSEIFKFRSIMVTIFDKCDAPIHVYFIMVLRFSLLILFSICAAYVGSHNGNKEDNDMNRGVQDSPFFNGILFITVYLLLSYVLQYSREIEQPFGSYVEDFPVKLWMNRKISSSQKYTQAHDKDDENDKFY